MTIGALGRLGVRSRATAIFLTGLLLAGAMAWYQGLSNESVLEAKLRVEATQLEQRLFERMRTYESGLRGARGAVISGGEDRIGREAFAAYSRSRDIAKEFPGARGFGFVRRVPAGGERAYIAGVRRNGPATFEIKELGANQGEHFVIEMVEPMAENAAALGLDIASEPRRRAAAISSIYSGEATLTEPLTLVQAAGAPMRGFLLLLPVYRDGAILDEPADQDAAVYGWSYAPLVMDDVLGKLNSESDNLHLRVTDVTPGRPALLVYEDVGRRSGGRPRGVAGLGSERFVRPVFGRQWNVEITPLPGFLEQHPQPPPLRQFVAWTVAAALFALLALAMGRAEERKRVASARESRLGAIVANSSDAIVGQDIEGRIESLNPAAERMFGLKAAQAAGLPLSELLIPELAENSDTQVRARVSSGDRVMPYDARCEAADGRVRDVSVTVCAIQGVDGPQGFASLVRDISGRKENERQLRKFGLDMERKHSERTEQLESARRHLESILDALPSLVGYWDRNLHTRFANAAFCEWFGLQPESAIGAPLHSLIGQSLFDEIEPRLAAAMEGIPQTFERQFIHPRLGQRATITYYLPDRRDGEVLGTYVLVTDVTELTESRQRLAAALRENEALLDTLNRHAIVSMADAQGRITHVNEAFCEISGYAREELLGQDHRMVNSGTHEAGFWSRVWRNIGSGTAWHGEVCNRAKDGSLYWVDSIIAPFRDFEGKIEKYISIRHDISELKLAQSELEKRTAQAEQASVAKTQFLANMSHEIRTPLNAIIGLSYILKQSYLQPEQRQSLDKIGAASRTLLSLINDVLDVSKIEAGHMELEEVPFDLHQIVIDLHDLFSEQARERGVELCLPDLKDLPRWLGGDSTRIKQILINLLSNALKFTAIGHVRLRMDVHTPDCHPEAGAPVMVRCVVEDSGIGINPSVREELFRPFTQADSSTTRRFGGTGLGLSIVRQLAALMHGDVALVSEVGKGSTFTVSLLLKTAAPPEAPAVAREVPIGASCAAGLNPSAGAAVLRGIRLLVVDDSSINIEVAAALLRAAGAAVESATNGQEALDVLTARGKAFDAVLMDIQMPVMDGIEATRRLRTTQLGKKLPVIALSAGILPSERDRALQAGVDEFIAKPVDPGTLATMVHRLLSGVGRRVHAATAESNPQLEEAFDGPTWIVSAAGRRLFREHPAMYTALLDRLFEEFGEMCSGCPPSMVAGSPGRDHASLAAHLHKLRGSAAALGLEHIVQACRALELDHASAHAASSLADALSVIDKARHLLQAKGAPGWQKLAGPALDPERLKDLRRLLQDRNFAAIGMVEKNAEVLRSALGEQFGVLQKAVVMLDFDSALQVLESAS
jgi:PAS domain S-box-containing protein